MSQRQQQQLELNSTSGLILGIMHRNELNGELTAGDVYRIADELMAPYWNTTRSHVYRELPVLAQRGLVRPGRLGTRNAQPYRLTTRGRRAFRDWMLSESRVDALRLQLPLRVAFSELITSYQLSQTLYAARSRHIELLNEVKMMLTFTVDQRLSTDHAALLFAHRYHEMVLAWLDEITKSADHRDQYA